VNGDSYREMAEESHRIVQGFLNRDAERTVRVRLIDDRQGRLTVKGKGRGAAHPEFEYPIPAADARELLAMCEPPLVDKTRYIIMYEGDRWEVDEFHGHLQGLVVAELEVPSVDYRYALPPFAGREVTGDARYYNANLTQLPDEG